MKYFLIRLAQLLSCPFAGIYMVALFITEVIYKTGAYVVTGDAINVDVAEQFADWFEKTYMRTWP